jgi:hypothetical protein
MFAKIANYKIPHFNVAGVLGATRAAERRHARVTPMPFPHANDNHRGRSVPACTDRPRLTCHWQINPVSGGLECRWAAASDDEAELPHPRQPRGLVDRAAPMLLSA